MGIFLIAWVIILIIAVIVGLYHKDVHYKFFCSSTAIFSAVWAGVIMIFYGIISLVIIAESYNNYLNARAYYDNLLAQHRAAIVMYEDKAVAIDMEKAARGALTDLRFQGYQEKMASFIMDLRSNIIWYNKMVIKKNYMKKNFFYNWYIVAPDPDMKPVNIVELKGE
jgi:hypothetical protein